MIKLDVGCGGRGSAYPEFIGIDIWPKPERPRTDATYLQLDFIKDLLPFEKNTVDEIIAGHIIEHLLPEDGERLIKRAYHLLKLGSQLFITCPNLKLFCEKYIQGDEQFYKKEYAPGNEMWKGDTLADRLNYQIHQNTHKWSYDQESLTALANRAGCERVEPLPNNHHWSKRPDHEIGIIITKV